MKQLTVLIRGAGEMASAVALRLYSSHFRVIMTERNAPLCVRRTVSYSEALTFGRAEVEGARADLIDNPDRLDEVWALNRMAVLIDPDLSLLPRIRPDVVVDAILAKKNLGLRMDMAELVIGLGPGFTAGLDAHVVIETNRGHNLGRLIYHGEAEPNTGIPGVISGESAKRVLRAADDGIFESELEIGSRVVQGQIVGRTADSPIKARLDGIVRGLIRPGTRVWSGLKVGDVDPRGRMEYTTTVSDKARAIGGSVLEAVLHHFNQ